MFRFVLPRKGGRWARAAHVVKENVLSHRPELNSNTSLSKHPSSSAIKFTETIVPTHDRVKVGRRVVLKVSRVVNLLGCPHSDVLGVVNQGCEPLALVSRVGNLGSLPGSTAGFALGVGDGRCDPLAIVLVTPLLGLLLA